MLIPHGSLGETLAGASDLSLSRLEALSAFQSQNSAQKPISLVNEQHKQAEKEVKMGLNSAHILGVSTSSFFFFYEARLY